MTENQFRGQIRLWELIVGELGATSVLRDCTLKPFTHGVISISLNLAEAIHLVSSVLMCCPASERAAREAFH